MLSFGFEAPAPAVVIRSKTRSLIRTRSRQNSQQSSLPCPGGVAQRAANLGNFYPESFPESSRAVLARPARLACPAQLCRVKVGFTAGVFHEGLFALPPPGLWRAPPRSAPEHASCDVPAQLLTREVNHTRRGVGPLVSFC
jgi:hypothetical protein